MVESARLSESARSVKIQPGCGTSVAHLSPKRAASTGWSLRGCAIDPLDVVALSMEVCIILVAADPVATFGSKARSKAERVSSH